MHRPEVLTTRFSLLNILEPKRRSIIHVFPIQDVRLLSGLLMLGFQSGRSIEPFSGEDQDDGGTKYR
jgi:hypothetical protein